MKQIKNVETGKVYHSVSSAARDIGTTPGMIVHVLKNRQRSAGGYTWAYNDEPSDKIHRTSRFAYRQRDGRIIRDDTGKSYETIKALSIDKGITPARAQYLVSRDPERIFRNAWLRDVPRHRFVFAVIGNHIMCNGVAIGVSKRQCQFHIYRIAPNMTVHKLHNALDKVLYEGYETYAIYYGDAGWAIEPEGDLFA